MSALPSSISADDTAEIISAPVGAGLAQNWAVVSFLLEDASWCDWLYREFDGERVPRPLIARPGRFGTPYPDRLSVCPDPADPAELESYAESLQSAQHLILIVSPTSGKSLQLSEHLRLFKAAGGEERVIALVVKGEPASPSCEPGSADDISWLPSWLEFRFENNRFRPAGAADPLVIDARLGVASLAEARAAIMAALLEVEPEALKELGIVTRPTTSLLEFPAPSHLANVAPATPSGVAFVEIAEDYPVPQRQRPSLPLWICTFAALAALAILVLLPGEPDGAISKAELGSARHGARGVAAGLPADFPLVEVRPILDEPLPPPKFLKFDAEDTGLIEALQPVAAIEADVAAQETGLSRAAGDSRMEQKRRRDEITRIAEKRMSEGNANEALQFLEQALAHSASLLTGKDSTSMDFHDTALLHRRAGTLAEGLALPQVAKKHYESGRRVLLELSGKSSLSKEGIRVLADLDSRLRELRR